MHRSAIASASSRATSASNEKARHDCRATVFAALAAAESGRDRLRDHSTTAIVSIRRETAPSVDELNREPKAGGPDFSPPAFGNFRIGINRESGFYG